MVLKREPFGEGPRLLCPPLPPHLSAPALSYRCGGREAGNGIPETFSKEQKAPPPLGLLPRCPSPAQGPCEAGPETPRPRRGAAFLGSGCHLVAVARTAGSARKSALAGLPASPRGSPGDSVGPCGRPPCRDRTEAGARTDIPGVGSWPTAFRRVTWRKFLLC